MCLKEERERALSGAAEEEMKELEECGKVTRKSAGELAGGLAEPEMVGGGGKHPLTVGQGTKSQKRFREERR